MAFPAFCVLLGCERRQPGLAADADGEMVIGVTYDPLRDEMFTAERGSGGAAERAADPRLRSEGSAGVADRNGLSQSEAP